MIRQRDILSVCVGLSLLCGIATAAEVPSPVDCPVTAELAQTAQRDWAKHHGLPVEMKNSLEMEFLLIPPGRFTMRSPIFEPGQPESEASVDVTLTNAFYLARHEVTQHSYQTVMGKNPSWFCSNGPGKERVLGMDTARFPVDNVNCLEAADFCKKLTTLEYENGKLPQDWVYRLPTEAQWEYACRAGTESPWNTGREPTPATANLGGYVKLSGALQRTTTVGSYPPNAWGLHDMHGNVQEWCNDGHSAKLPGGKDPFTPPLVNFPPRAAGFVAAQRPAYYRMYRGGGWGSAPATCRSGNRSTDSPLNAGNMAGFRVARVYVGAASLPAADAPR